MAIELALQYSATLKFTIKCSDIVYVGDRLREYVFHYDHKDEAAIAFDVKEDHALMLYKEHSDVEVMVEFLFNRSFFATLHQTLQNLSMEAIRKVFPLESCCLPSRNCKKIANYHTFDHALKLDRDFQLPALEAMLNCSSSFPFLLMGPFGTGKTRVITRAALESVSATDGGRVLICVHHHRTANAYVEDCFGPLKRYTQPLEIVRLVGSYHRIPKDSSYKNVYKTPTDYGRIKGKAIVICTYTVAAQLKREIGLQGGHFRYIFLDEAAQALEPEAMIPLQLATMDTKVILAGDHLQVGL